MMLALFNKIVKKALSQKENFPLIEALKPFLHKGLIEESRQLTTLGIVENFLEKIKGDGNLTEEETKYANSLVKDLSDKVKGIRSVGGVKKTTKNV